MEDLHYNIKNTEIKLIPTDRFTKYIPETECEDELRVANTLKVLGLYNILK